MYDDPELYSQYHRTTIRDGNLLVNYALSNMFFGEEDVVMDVGCGPGDNTRDILLRRLPKLKKIIAIDILPKMIEFARQHEADEKIEYHLANIEDKSSLKPWEGSISKIFSTYCVMWLKDQRKAFQNMKDLLIPKGEAVVTFVLSYPMYDCHPILTKNDKWNRYLKDAELYTPDSHGLNLGAEHYRKMFEDLGFEIIHCVEEKKTHCVPDDIELKGGLKSRSALTSHIPEELREEFAEDLFNVFMQLIHRNPEGKPVITARILTAHIRKP